MKLIIESTDEFVACPAGRARLWGGHTEEGFRCLLLVRVIVKPEVGPDEDFTDVAEPYDGPNLSPEEVDRLAAIAQPDREIVDQRAKMIAELKAIARDHTMEVGDRLEAYDCMDWVELGLRLTQEFWRRVVELRRKRDKEPPANPDGA